MGMDMILMTALLRFLRPLVTTMRLRVAQPMSIPIRDTWQCRLSSFEILFDLPVPIFWSISSIRPSLTPMVLLRMLHELHRPLVLGCKVQARP